jgi:8-oxo-dGTP pyrophosphatase MutT (NUDIX family)/broad specificity phosphatase PhoE
VSRIIAAGAVLWRPGGVDELEICVIHRPRHDDWSLPKGKADPGEHVLATAVREVLEETGNHVMLGRPLPSTRYKVGGRRKTVYFWAARANDAAPPWTATSEVDEVCFLPAGQALAELSYDDERAVLQAFLDDPRPTTSIVLLRHTAALHRSKWGGDDALRPLSKAGRRAAKELVAPLSALGAERVISSDAARCSESVRRFADARGIELELDSGVSEHGYADAPERTRAVIRKIVADGRPTVVCSHRPVLPILLSAATEGAEGAVPTDTLPPGGFHVLHIADGRVIAIDTPAT